MVSPDNIHASINTQNNQVSFMYLQIHLEIHTCVEKHFKKKKTINWKVSKEVYIGGFRGRKLKAKSCNYIIIFKNN